MTELEFFVYVKVLSLPAGVWFLVQVPVYEYVQYL